MTSHRKLGGIEISIGQGGLRFKKRPPGFNLCIGKALKGTAGPHEGGRYDKGFQAKFTAAVHGCAGKKEAASELAAAPKKRKGLITEEPLLSP
jgi:hypothetical protein